MLTKHGHFSVQSSRHFIAPLDAIRSEHVREVNIRAPVRSGKTLIADVAVPWSICNDGASVLWIFQGDDVAKDHAEIRLWPILESCPAIQPLIPSNRHHKRVQEIIFNSGLPLFVKGQALGNLQSRGFKFVICDEPWLYKPGRINEAKGRLGDFVRMANSKLLCISQGGTEEDDWETQFSSGELNEWEVPCLGCGEFMLPKWTGQRPDGSRWGMVWDSEKDHAERYNVELALATMRFECPACRHHHHDTEATRAEWNQRGRYAVIGREIKANKSFHWTALIDYPWAELLKEWLAARESAHVGNVGPTVQFWQKRMADKKSEATAHEGHQSFSRIATETTDPKSKAWEGEAMRFLTVDRQAEDVYWATIRAWAKGTGESRRLWFGRLYSEHDIEQKREEYGVTPNHVGIDSGYRPKGDQGVYSACIRYGWLALKGADESWFWHFQKSQTPGVQPMRVQKPYSPLTFGEPEGMMKGRKAPLVRFSAPVCADKVQSLIDNGQWIEPQDRDDDMEREYKAQMAGEFKRRKINKFTGRQEMVWVCPSGNNHAFDCAKEQVAMAMIAGLL